MKKPAITLAIIGAGNIGTAIANGLLSSSKPLVEKIILTKRKLQQLSDYPHLGVQITTNNAEAISQSNIVILALQPAQIVPFLKKYKAVLAERSPIIASVATNITLSQIQNALSTVVSSEEDDIDLVRNEPINSPIYRIMPNTAIAVKESMTCISRVNSSEAQDQFIEALFKTVGEVLFIEDELMNAATVLCACGTAFALRYIRAASQGGTEIGFHAEEALKLAAQTVKGAATLITQTGQHPEQAIDQVTTPMGCTIAGMNEMEHQGFSSATIKGIRKSYERARDI